MKFMSHFAHRALTAHALIIMGLISSLLGCAPGTGGTGTGPITTSAVLSSDAIPNALDANPSTASAFTFTASSVDGSITIGPTGGVPAPTPTVTPGTNSLLPACPTSSPSAPPTTLTAIPVNTPTFSASSGNTPTASLSLSSQGIRYQQSCYLFTYQGSWKFDDSLSLTVQGSVTNVLLPGSGVFDASLKLRTSGSLSEPGVSVNAMLLNSSGVQVLPAAVLQASKP